MLNKCLYLICDKFLIIWRYNYEKNITVTLNVLSYAASSGYGIASRALTAVMKAHDGRGPATMLTNSILQSLGLSSPDEIIGYLSRNSCPMYTFRLIVVRLFIALYRVIISPTNALLNAMHCNK